MTDNVSKFTEPQYILSFQIMSGIHTRTMEKFLFCLLTFALLATASQIDFARVKAARGKAPAGAKKTDNKDKPAGVTTP